MSNVSLAGTTNIVALNPVTNAEFTKSLGQALARPTLFPVPGFAARLAFGEMADALLLSSQRVDPAKLRAVGYDFLEPELSGALQRILQTK